MTIFEPDQLAIFEGRIQKIEEKGFTVALYEHPALDMLIISIKKSGQSIETVITGLEIMHSKDFASFIDAKLGTAIKKLVAASSKINEPI
jgi:hypothetical protein